MADQSGSGDCPTPSRVAAALFGDEGEKLRAELLAMATTLMARYPGIGKTPEDLVASTIRTALHRELEHKDGIDEAEDIRQWIKRRMLTKKDDYKRQHKSQDHNWKLSSDVQPSDSANSRESLESQVPQPEFNEIEEAREQLAWTVHKLALANDSEVREVGVFVLLGYSAFQISQMTKLSEHQVRRRIGRLRDFLDAEMGKDSP